MEDGRKNGKEQEINWEGKRGEKERQMWERSGILSQERHGYK